MLMLFVVRARRFWEAIEEKLNLMQFYPCGGGGLASGSFIVFKEYCQKPKYFCEPANANDIAISVRENKILLFFSPKFSG